MCNYFIAELKPFSNRNDGRIRDFQEKSIEEGVCGMGWGDYPEYFPDNIDPYPISNEKNRQNGYAECWLKEKVGQNDSTRPINTALNRYKEMGKGDYIFTRLYETGMCYIGKVQGEAYHSKEKEENFSEYSFVVDVDWTSIGHFSAIPNALRGLMQRQINTIQRIGVKHDIARKLIKNIYEKNNEKIELNSDNFCKALDPMDLEDIVGMYILDKEKGYQFIPSSCKLSEPCVEFVLCNDNLEKITCQVKNQAEIDLDIYEKISDKCEKISDKCEKISDPFKKIYVFSGLGKYKGKNSDKIEKIDKEDLYNFFKENTYFKEKYKEHYSVK